MARTILVTGAAGFIGSHLADALLARGDSVIALDNLNDYYSVDRKRANLAEVRDAGHPGRFEFVEGDIRDRDLVDTLVKNHTPTAIVHLAAMAGVGRSIDDPNLYFDVNVLGTVSLLDVAAAHGIQNFVLASTSSVYGATETLPFVETDPCDRPLVPYSASKRAAEVACHAYHHLYGQNITALRFFTVYGPRGRPDMMAYKIAESIRSGGSVPLFNGGEMYRDWTFISDVVDGVVAATDQPLGFEVLNLGRGEPVRLGDFVELIHEMSGKAANLEPMEMPPGDIPRTAADISKAKRLLGYDPQISVSEGIQRFLDWFGRS